MAKEMKGISSWVFLIGIIIAIVLGLVLGAGNSGRIDLTNDTTAYIAAILGIIGLIAGILALLGMGTITKEEIPTFMIATVIILVIGASDVFDGLKWFGDYLMGIVTALGIFISPLAGLIAIKAIWDIGKD
ncbi:hypothetical protein B6U81_04490 [Thermoplasmatales archaeon ex4484_30]|nr:MAG: hypothetical protein B6U81_04490 [Thermoplasmatales archaeon ex4484_30]